MVGGIILSCPQPQKPCAAVEDEWSMDTGMMRTASVQCEIQEFSEEEPCEVSDLQDLHADGMQRWMSYTSWTSFQGPEAPPKAPNRLLHEARAKQMLSFCEEIQRHKSAFRVHVQKKRDASGYISDTSSWNLVWKGVRGLQTVLNIAP